MRAFGVCGVLVYRRDQQPLRQDQRRLLAGPPSTVRHRGQVCVQGLRQARRRRAAAGFSASPNGYRLVPRPSGSSLRASPPRRHDRRPARSGFTPRIEETPSRRIVPKLATLGKVTPEPHTQMPRPRDRFPAARFPQRPRWQRPSGGLCRQLACWCRRRSSITRCMATYLSSSVSSGQSQARRDDRRPSRFTNLSIRSSATRSAAMSLSSNRSYVAPRIRGGFSG